MAHKRRGPDGISCHLLWQALTAIRDIVNNSRMLITFICFALLAGCGDMSLCSNTIYGEKYSPDRENKAVIFDRGCGASTGFSTQISILPIDDELPNESGNILIIDGHPESHNLKVTWASSAELDILNLGSQEVFQRVSSLNGIKVRYGK